MFTFGYSEIDITPQDPIVLGAYHRYRGQNRATEQVLEPLKATIFYFKDQQGSRSILLSLDLIWVSEQLTDWVAEWCRDLYGIEKDNILITATHSHSTPQIHPRITNHGNIDEHYINKLFNCVKKGIKRAISETTPASLTHFSVPINTLPICNRVSFGRNPFTFEQVGFLAPNPSRPIDQVIRVSLIYRPEVDTPIAVLLNMAVHPVFNKKNRVSSDYPGTVRKKLKSHFGKDCPIAFLQGFSGDIKPCYTAPFSKQRLVNILLRSSLRPPFKRDIYSNLETFAQQTTNLIMQGYYKNTNHETVSPDLNNQYKKQSENLFNDKKLQLNVSRFDLPEGPSLIGINGEVFAHYLEDIRELNLQRPAWPVAYANGMLGYLPDPDMLEKQTGYEYHSWRMFNLPRAFTPSLSKKLEKSIKSLEHS